MLALILKGMTAELTLPSFAKINLHCSWLDGAPDGFHDLCTSFSDDLAARHSHDLPFGIGGHRMTCGDSRIS
jgi:hypothetical protein